MKLNVQRYGDSGSHLTILHGLLGSARNWHRVARELSRDFQMLIPDLRNHGDSPHGKHNIAAMRDDVLELLDREQIEQTTLIGHSMGGLAAMAFAVTHPERLKALIVVDIAPVARLDGLSYIFDALQNLDLTRVDRREDAEEQLSEEIPNPGVRQFLLQNLKRQEDGSYAWRCNLTELADFSKNEQRFQLNKDDRYAGPALFIGGGASEHRIWEHENVIAHHFPNYQLEVLNGVGHWVHFEAMGEFVELVTHFINKV